MEIQSPTLDAGASPVPIEVGVRILRNSLDNARFQGDAVIRLIDAAPNVQAVSNVIQESGSRINVFA